MRLRSGIKSCLIAVLTVFLWTFNSLACFLIKIVGSFLMAIARVVKNLSFHFLINPLLLLFHKKLFFHEKNFLLCIQ